MPGVRERFARIALGAGIALASCKAGDNVPGDARCPVICVVDCPPGIICPTLAECAQPPKYLCPPGYKPLGSADAPGATTAPPVASMGPSIGP
jgi:hypothetical protein